MAAVMAGCAASTRWRRRRFDVVALADAAQQLNQLEVAREQWLLELF
jgi:hypothetical protein